MMHFEKGHKSTKTTETLKGVLLQVKNNMRVNIAHDLDRCNCLSSMLPCFSLRWTLSRILQMPEE